MYTFLKTYMGTVPAGDSRLCEVSRRGWWVYTVRRRLLHNPDHTHSYKVTNHNFMNIENIKKNQQLIAGIFIFKKYIAIYLQFDNIDAYTMSLIV